MGIHYDYKSTKSAKLMEKQAKREKKLAEKKAKRLAKEGSKKDELKASTVDISKPTIKDTLLEWLKFVKRRIIKHNNYSISNNPSSKSNYVNLTNYNFRENLVTGGSKPPLTFGINQNSKSKSNQITNKPTVSIPHVTNKPTVSFAFGKESPQLSWARKQKRSVRKPSSVQKP